MCTCSKALLLAKKKADANTGVWVTFFLLTANAKSSLWDWIIPFEERGWNSAIRNKLCRMRSGSPGQQDPVPQSCFLDRPGRQQGEHKSALNLCSKESQLLGQEELFFCTKQILTQRSKCSGCLQAGQVWWCTRHMRKGWMNRFFPDLKERLRGDGIASFSYQMEGHWKGEVKLFLDLHSGRIRGNIHASWIMGNFSYWE